ncbi:hypothetical protein [Magnetofaba australis]|uniref:Uncharacterized protein n=1 Tax=Magnetofaba australis IT-1 TaxID=1434232 RepID=A0A1Y2K4P6_9PROT|nr:hypothetical protein [Magnetofaba australis]OSM03953.1 hypothetical protein MAIT1_03806 [Magnetofaba australis IT-1]
MSMLEIIQEASDLLGLSRPEVVISSVDKTVRALLAALNAEGKALSRRADWKALHQEVTFGTSATSEQYRLSDIAADFGRLINNSIWNRTTKQRIHGPLNPREWQQIQATSNPPMNPTYRIGGGMLYLYPPPEAGQSVSFAYISTFWCETPDHYGRTKFMADNDVGRLDEHLLMLGTVWRFLQSKGLPYGEPFAQYERAVHSALSRDGGRHELEMIPGLGQFSAPRAPDGNWNV